MRNNPKKQQSRRLQGLERESQSESQGQDSTRVEERTISAKAWAIYDLQKQAIVEGIWFEDQREIASLTKVFTFLACWKVIQRLKLRYTELRVSVTKAAAASIGTSARLTYDSWLTVEDLFYGMLLPSGNDSALLLAQTFGLLLDYQSKHSKNPEKVRDLAKAESIDMAQYQRQKSVTRLVDIFMNFTNKLVEESGWEDTYLSNPTGLSDPNSFSTAEEVCHASALAFEIKPFQEIVGTRKRLAKVFKYDGSAETDPFEHILWKNTNELLGRGYRGIKTGMTKSAGGCLSSYYQADSGDFIIVVLGCSNSQSQRFRDTETIRQNYIEY